MEGIPVYNSVRRAVDEHAIEASILFVPPRFAKDALFEALSCGIKKVVILCEGIPLHDTLQMRKAAITEQAIVIGANTSGLISTGKAMMGFFPDCISGARRWIAITRSGSLTNEITAQVVKWALELPPWWVSAAMRCP